MDYIKAIAEYQSISIAAENIGISQPALSAYLKKKERELGTVLFDRSKQPIQLTESGRVYLKYSEKRESLEKELRQAIADIEGLKTGKLVIGGASFFNVSYLPKAVAEFQKRYPGISVEIVDGKIPEITSEARKGLLDLFITPVVDEDSRFEYEELIEEIIYLAVPSDWPINQKLKSKAAVEGADAIPLNRREFGALCTHTFIVLKKDQDLGGKMEELFRLFECRPEHTVVAEQTITSLAMTVSGVGVSLITQSSISSSQRKNQPVLYIADENLCRRTLYIAYSKYHYLSKAATAFINVLKEVNQNRT